MQRGGRSKSKVELSCEWSHINVFHICSSRHWCLCLWVLLGGKNITESGTNYFLTIPSSTQFTEIYCRFACSLSFTVIYGKYDSFNLHNSTHIYPPFTRACFYPPVTPHYHTHERYYCTWNPFTRYTSAYLSRWLLLLLLLLNLSTAAALLHVHHFSMSSSSCFPPR